MTLPPQKKIVHLQHTTKRYQWGENPLIPIAPNCFFLSVVQS